MAQTRVTPTPTTKLIPPSRRKQSSQQSMPSLRTMSGKILEESRQDLQHPFAITTFDKMMKEPIVSLGPNVYKMQINRVPWRIVVPDDSPPEEKKRAKLLNRNLHDLERPWKEYVGEFCNILKYGFMPLEKIYKDKNYDGEKFFGWDHFPVIAPISVDKWYQKSNGALAGLRQVIGGLNDLRGSLGDSNNVELHRNKFLLFRYNPEKDNPEGNSPLKNVYIAWKYLSLIEEIEAVQIQKDLGGILNAGIPLEYFIKAIEEPDGPEAEFVSKLEAELAAVSNGDQNFFLRANAYEEGAGGKPLYTVETLETRNSSSNSTSEIVQRHANKILMAFFADVLKLGQDGVGSYALADSKTSILAMAIESVLMSITDTLNHDLIRQTYRLNRWEYNPETSARFEFGDLEKLDLDVASKFIQRILSTEGMERTDDLNDLARELLGLKPKSVVNPKVRGVAAPASRAGDGQKTAGDGTATKKGGNDKSIGNTENASSYPINNGNGTHTVLSGGKEISVLEEDLKDWELEVEE